MQYAQLRAIASFEDHFKPAIQLGLTATPKETREVSTLTYFGPPVYTYSLKQGIESEVAKKISKTIRDEGPKGVQAQIQGDQLRVSSKKRDDLQAVIAKLKEGDFGVPLQFQNFRD